MKKQVVTKRRLGHIKRTTHRKNEESIVGSRATGIGRQIVQLATPQLLATLHALRQFQGMRDHDQDGVLLFGHFEKEFAYHAGIVTVEVSRRLIGQHQGRLQE
jgi:hypothetical protein